MAIRKSLADKWDRELYAWALWSSQHGRLGARISAAYDGMPGTNGRPQITPLSDQILETDALMRILSRHRQAGGTRLYRALLEWAYNDGTRGQQAMRLSIHSDTYRDRVGQAIALLEALSRNRNRKRSTPKRNATPCVFPQNP